MRIVIAPDSFKGTATAHDVALAIREGWCEVRPEDFVDLIPFADGGEGTLAALAGAEPRAIFHDVTVHGPADQDVHACWVELPGKRGVVELANTSGIELLSDLRPGTAHTWGFGQAIADALDHGMESLTLAIGSSCSTDAGTGMLRALGADLFDASGDPLPLGGAALSELACVHFDGLAPLPPGGVTVCCDVDAPLLGPRGAAAVFGPQKGIQTAEVERYESALAHFASFLPSVDAEAAGTGAAGGTGYGLLAWGAALVPGAVAVAEALNADERIREADLVITGEGRYDGQSDMGKAPALVRALADRHGKSSALIAGTIASETGRWEHALSLAELAGSVDSAMTHTSQWLREAGRQLAVSITRSRVSSATALEVDGTQG
ncbi:glycerate kinase [Paenarthrobacter sp. NPDC058040]|uniref:glycerate kinase n=1 Tax=unclassified Paenarthrobacter TaxID=2634190 RepID=UPI0036DBFAB1